MLWKGLAFGTVMAAMFHSCSTGSVLARGKRWSCRGKRRSHLEASKARPSRLDVTQQSCAAAWQGSILSREQLFKPDSGRPRGGEIRGAETQQEATTMSTERDNVAWTC